MQPVQQQSHLLHCGGVVPVARPAGRFLLPVASPAGRFLLPPSSSSCSRAGSSSTTACVHAVEHSCSTSGRSSTPWKNATRALHQLHHQVPRAYSTEGSLQLHQHPQYQHQQLYQNQELQTGCPDSSGTTTTTTTRQRHQRQLSSLVLASSVLSALSLAWPNTASASGGALTGGALDLFRQFLVSARSSHTAPRLPRQAHWAGVTHCSCSWCMAALLPLPVLRVCCNACAASGQGMACVVKL